MTPRRLRSLPPVLASLLATALVAGLAACSQEDERGAERDAGPDVCLPHDATAEAPRLAASDGGSDADAEADADQIAEHGAVTDVQRSGDGSVLVAYEAAAPGEDGQGPARSAWVLCSPAGERVAGGLGPATETDGGARVRPVPLDDGFLVTPEWGAFAPLSADGTLGEPVVSGQQPPPVGPTKAGDRVFDELVAVDAVVRPGTGDVLTPPLLAADDADGYVPGTTTDAWGVSADGRVWGQFGRRIRYADGDRWRPAGRLPASPGTSTGLAQVVGDHLVAITVDNTLGFVSALHVRPVDEARGEWVAAPMPALLDDTRGLAPAGPGHLLVPLADGPAVLDVVAGTLERIEAPGEVWAGPEALLSVDGDVLVASVDGGATWEPAYSG